METITKTSSAWAQANPILAYGQKGIESDTGREKVGDGVSSWAPLNYLDGSSGGELVKNRFFIGFYSDPHPITPGDTWAVDWNTDDAWTPEQAYPGTLGQNLDAFPVGVYAFHWKALFSEPIPKDVLVALSITSSTGVSPDIDISAGRFFLPADLGSGFENDVNFAGTLIVREGTTNLLFSVTADHANSTDSADTTPYELFSSYLSLNRIL